MRLLSPDLSFREVRGPASAAGGSNVKRMYPWVLNPKLADLVTVGKDHTVYRSCGVALTKKGKESPIPARFAAFLQSKEGAAIFRKWGWTAP